MGDLSISQLLSGSPPERGSPAKIRHAAQEFEGLMIEQLLRVSREGGGGWLGTGGDSSCDGATEYAEQHFAMVLAEQGGLGMASLISRGLAARAAAEKAPDRADPTAP